MTWVRELRCCNIPELDQWNMEADMVSPGCNLFFSLHENDKSSLSTRV